MSLFFLCGLTTRERAPLGSGKSTSQQFIHMNECNNQPKWHIRTRLIHRTEQSRHPSPSHRQSNGNQHSQFISMCVDIYCANKLNSFYSNSAHLKTCWTLAVQCRHLLTSHEGNQERRGYVTCINSVSLTII